MPLLYPKQTYWFAAIGTEQYLAANPEICEAAARLRIPGDGPGHYRGGPQANQYVRDANVRRRSLATTYAIKFTLDADGYIIENAPTEYQPLLSLRSRAAGQAAEEEEGDAEQANLDALLADVVATPAPSVEDMTVSTVMDSFLKNVPSPAEHAAQVRLSIINQALLCLAKMVHVHQPAVCATNDEN